MPRPRKKIKLTWAELRQQRKAQERFELYLPLLQLKQQQLQSAILKAEKEYQTVQASVDIITEKISGYRDIFNEPAGVNLGTLSEPEDVKTVMTNVAGVKVPVFESAAFPQAGYSLFSTPDWIDRALSDQCEKNLGQLKLEILGQKLMLLRKELKKITQRVNLFEKIIIPETRENIRRIRIALNDRMTAAVARAKFAKKKTETRRQQSRPEVGSL
jgi:V/A-type H+/Na+-transporting ATPase subunit D